jgi:hypothetical protein
VFVWFQRAADRSVETVKFVDTLPLFKEHEQHKARAHLAAAFLNAAAVLVKKNEQDHVVYACTKSLEYEPKNAKAYFRRAQVDPPEVDTSAICVQKSHYAHVQTGFTSNRQCSSAFCGALSGL